MSQEIILLTRGEFAQRLKRSERTIQRWDPLLGRAVIRIGGSIYYNYDAAMEKIQRGEADTTNNKKRRTQ